MQKKIIFIVSLVAPCTYGMKLPYIPVGSLPSEYRINISAERSADIYSPEAIAQLYQDKSKEKKIESLPLGDKIVYQASLNTIKYHQKKPLVREDLYPKSFKDKEGFVVFGAGSPPRQ